MKKLLYFIFTFILVNLFNFMPALADEKSYEINKVDINAVIMDNGDVNVIEYLTYDFSGDFNGFNRRLNSNGADGCIINSVSIVDKSGVEIVSRNENTGSENTYELSESGYEKSIKVYSKSSNEEKTLKVNYTIINATKKYESTGELYWNFYSVENIPYINEANLNISFNNKILTTENSRYEIFGDGEFSTSYIDGRVNINYQNLSSLIGIDLTIPSEFLVNSSIIENSNNNTNNSSDYIILEEKSQSSNGPIVAMILFFVGIVVSIFVVYTNNKKKYNEAVDKYRSGYDFISNVQYTEPPYEISPALVSLLMGNKYIASEILSSTLFYLCNLGYYSMEECEYVDKGFFGDKTKSDLVFKRNSNKEMIKENHLEFIIKWFSVYEEDNRFSLLEIQKELKKSSEGQKFLEKLNEWRDIVNEDWQAQNHFIIIENKKTLTNEAYNEKLKWLSYQNYVEKTINLKERLNDINTADTMIIYARALDINSNLIEKYINEVVNVAESSADYDMNSFNNIHYFNYYLLHMNSMNSIYNNVMPDNSSSIDASGGFTGSSSGGDFGGGGGGGSDAF